MQHDGRGVQREAARHDVDGGEVERERRELLQRVLVAGVEVPPRRLARPVVMGVDEPEEHRRVQEAVEAAVEEVVDPEEEVESHGREGVDEDGAGELLHEQEQERVLQETVCGERDDVRDREWARVVGERAPVRRRAEHAEMQNEEPGPVGRVEGGRRRGHKIIFFFL